MQRPPHVTVAGTLTLAWAAYGLVFGVLYATEIVQIPGLGEMTPPQWDPATFRILVGACTMFGGAIWIPLGIGLLRLKRWARTLALVLYGVGLPMNLLYAVSVRTTFGVDLFIVQIASIVTQLIVIGLLLHAPVRAAFGVPTEQGPRPSAVRTRPLGVNILVALCILAATGTVVFGAVYAIAFPRLDPQMAADPEMLRMMRVGMVTGTLPWVVGYILCAIGLWRMRNWARILMIVFAFFWLLPALVFAAVMLIALATRDAYVIGLTLVITLLMGGIPGWTLWYLFRARTKQLFTAPAPTKPTMSS